MLNAIILIPILMILLLCACGKKAASSNSSTVLPSIDKSTTNLYNDDLVALQSEEIIGTTKNINQVSSRRFANLFPSQSSTEILNFINERIHFVTTQKSFDSATMNAKPINVRWITEQITTEDFPQKSNLVADIGDIKAVAINYSVLLWMFSALDETIYSITIDGKNIPLDSSRVGIIILTDNYSVDAKNIPYEHRISTLIHEARHSDCTGGLTEQNLKTIRAFSNFTEYKNKNPNKECGHLHVTCPDSVKGYAGVDACDETPWGGYAISAVYLNEVSYKYLKASKEEMSESDWVNLSILVTDYIDRYTRLLYDRTKLETEKPDLSSQGIIQ